MKITRATALALFLIITCILLITYNVARETGRREGWDEYKQEARDRETEKRHRDFKKERDDELTFVETPLVTRDNYANTITIVAGSNGSDRVGEVSAYRYSSADKRIYRTRLKYQEVTPEEFMFLECEQ